MHKERDCTQYKSLESHFSINSHMGHMKTNSQQKNNVPYCRTNILKSIFSLQTICNFVVGRAKSCQCC